MANVISDIAGQYDTLMALLDKMPDDEPVSIGDMVDRGPDSKKVLDFFMQNGSAILGNHEHMMLDFGRGTGYYNYGTWVWNGGGATLDSFGGFITDRYLNWLDSLPYYLEIDGCLISHAFLDPSRNLQEACDLGVDWRDSDPTIIWSRAEPIRRDEWKLQIAGHNSHMGYKRFSDEEGEYAICLDASRSKVLTGINTKTLEVYQVEYQG